MTDYFALLNQPRAPWLDPDQLKDAYHKQTLQTHPDAQPSGRSEGADSAFSTLNEAYQVLQDPKRRLQHLLSLEGRPPSSSGQTIPKQLDDLFPEVGALTQRAQLLVEKFNATSNALSRSLLKPSLLEFQRDAKETREKLRALSDVSLAELHAIGEVWAKDRTDTFDRLLDLYYTFAYLTRWTAQLEEMEFQLSAH
ncbi:MAG: DnaJ subfamily er 11 [Verrucomicrobiota bacterium]|jgi:curved DNA-binding protein CbpA